MTQDFKTQEDTSTIGLDARGYALTHYVLAERLMQVKYRRIAQEIVETPSSDTLIHILEGGIRGYHNQTGGELWTEWNDGAQDLWYEMFDAGVLPWSIYDEDPIAKETRAVQV
jgi:hypothetical protein